MAACDNSAPQFRIVQIVADMSHAPFQIDFQSASLDELVNDNHVLAAISFSDSSRILDKQKPVFSVNLTNLESVEDASLVEVWRSREPVQTHASGDLLLSCNSDILFGFIQLKEADFENLVDATEAAYQQILGYLEQSDYQYLLRIWNYFSSINDEVGGLERYRQFCLGRQRALDQFGNFPYAPPAATAIGAANGDLQVYFIAARDAGVQLENPRQVSAFLYPRKYGEVSPAFSRATYKQWGKLGAQSAPSKEHLYISGTASIVGHESQHPGQTREQLQETLKNVEALIQHAHETLDLSISQLQDVSHLKVYLRDASFLPTAKQVVEERLGVNRDARSPTVLYLQGDVCRADLLVEIEAACL